MKIVNISKSYRDVTALDGVSAEIREGAITGIVGRNGSGKTTLLEIIVGLTAADTGTIAYGAGITRANLRERLGVILQETAYYDQIKVHEILQLFASYYKKSVDVKPLIARLDLQPYLNKYVSKLSGGTQQRVNLALAFINAPSLAVLDEPTTGLDPLSREFFWTSLRSLAPGSTVLLSTHSMEEVEEYCDSLLVLNDGKLVFNGEVGGFVDRYEARSLNDAYLRMAGDR